MIEDRERPRPARRPRGAERVAAVAQAAAESLDLDRMVDGCLDRILELWDLGAATLLMVDPRTRSVQAVPSRGVRRADQGPDDFDTLDLCARCVARADVLVERGDRTHICVPLRGMHPADADGPRVLAVLHVVCRSVRPAADDDVRTLAAAADLIGLALQNALRLQHTERQTRILRGLNEIADLFSQSPRLQETLGVTLSRILEIAGAEIGSVFLRNTSGPGLSLAAHQGPPGIFVAEETVITPGRGEVGEVVQTGQMKVWCPVAPSATTGEPHARVCACVPLRSKGQVLGVLKTGCFSRASFSEEELEFLDVLGGQMGVAIENGTQFQIISEQAVRLSRRTGHLSTLLDLSDLMARAVELEGNVEACVKQLGDVVAVPLVIVLMDEGEGVARVLSSFVDRRVRRRGRRMQADMRFAWRELPTAQRALDTLRLVIVDEAMEGLGTNEIRWMLANDVRSALVLPLVVNGVALGALVLASVGTLRVFYPSELDFARTVANQLAMAIERERLFREVKQAARWLEQRVEERTRALLEANLGLQEATRQRSDFLKVMSHELRTPLNAIMGFSEVLADAATEVSMDEVREYSAAIHESGSNLLALINDILDLANATASRAGIHLEQLHVAGVVSGVLDIIRPQALARGVVLSSEVAVSLPPVAADRSRLKQILFNLLSNAVKFSPPQGRVTVGAQADDGVAWIQVDDEGPGIAPELHERVFEPFFQADGGLSRSHDGAGLGLSLARRYARLLGGELRLHSEPGNGSRFEFSVPLDRS